MRSSTGHTYAALPGRAGRIDVYRPPGQGPFPVLVWNAGSGWRSDRGYSDGADVARGLVKRPGFRGGSVIWNRLRREPVLQRS